MSDELQDRVRQVVADVLGVDAHQVTPATSPQTIENWDSVQHLNLVLAMEQAFGVQLSPEEIEKMQSVEMMVQVLRGKIG